MKPRKIIISEELQLKAPKLVCAVIQCDVQNSDNSEDLWAEIKRIEHHIREGLQISDIKNIPAIAATREAYKKCGKDPNRYRPSAEQLNRRILQGKGLYKISALVDLVNLISLQSGYSIGGFDADKLVGDLNYGIGMRNDVYRGIGRGLLNIEGLPVLRDQVGGVGTPTSDEERTMLGINTTQFLMNINAYNGENDFLHQTVDWSLELLKKYLKAENISRVLFS